MRDVACTDCDWEGPESDLDEQENCPECGGDYLVNIEPDGAGWHKRD